MNYQIITNPKKLHEFIEWLPELEANEKYYCCLFARKKYCEGQMKSSDKTQLKRFVSDKSRLFEKIKQLEVEIGAYKLKNIDAPQESLALYINPNPRDLTKATYDGIIQLTQLLKNNRRNFNPHAELLNCIQRSLGRQIFLDFDVDTKDFDFEKLKEVVNVSCLKILETRGGYHLLVRLSEVEPAHKKSFYNKIVALGVDQTGDQLLPVAGCVQGGFTPRFLEMF
ncbi:MAG: hypothetical protein R3E32_08745 [Chitinophagales bacterium]